MRMYIYTYIYIYIHACIHTYIHTYIHTLMPIQHTHPDNMSYKFPDVVALFHANPACLPTQPNTKTREGDWNMLLQFLGTPLFAVVWIVCFPIPYSTPHFRKRLVCRMLSYQVYPQCLNQRFQKLHDLIFVPWNATPIWPQWLSANWCPIANKNYVTSSSSGLMIWWLLHWLVVWNIFYFPIYWE